MADCRYERQHRAGRRATEGQGFKAADIIGIGINGVDAVSELSKAQATGFYGSCCTSPDVHGYKSSEMLYNWVAKGVEPTKFTGYRRGADHA